MQRVPALAPGAAVLPHRSHLAAHRAAVRPVEGVPELQRPAIFLEGFAGLPPPLEDGAQQRVHHRRAGYTHLDLPELVNPGTSEIVRHASQVFVICTQ